MEEVAEFLRIWDRRTELSTEVRSMQAFVDAREFRDGAGFRTGIASMRLRGDDSTNTKYWQNGDAWYHLRYGHQDYNGPKHRYKRKYWFSAAAQAIRFLRQLSRQQRLLISKLILNEDRPAAAFPESHMIGMIPFCLENPKLHVQHHINLWRNILARGDDFRIRGLMSYIEGPPLVLEDTPGKHQTQPEVIGRTFSGFIMHLLEALKKGLPPDSYSLIVGGCPDLNLATEVFSVSMKPYIAWLTAHTSCTERGLIAPASHHDYPFPTRTPAQEIAPAGASRIATLNEIMSLGVDFEADMLDVTTDLLDWEKVHRESYEMEELLEGVFAEPGNHRYLA
ncbi:hypothetical protein FDENT_11260 [Fusarium denticulatum]|uniref:Uncharacterized protein n=1 Tax=Fusarium denticulatum TaxID=48507 RepID=A0A8H5TJV0_9HYPO|nr:hypothetical protein FDENT_11260 [Fusarium denticulatum]